MVLKAISNGTFCAYTSVSDMKLLLFQTMFMSLNIKSSVLAEGNLQTREKQKRTEQFSFGLTMDIVSL